MLRCSAKLSPSPLDGTEHQRADPGRGSLLYKRVQGRLEPGVSLYQSNRYLVLSALQFDRCQKHYRVHH